MDRLREILDHKRTELAALLPRAAELRREALERDEYRGFRTGIDRGPGALGLIAEVKRASPSAGIIAADFDPVQTALAYERGGAHAVSVLTDARFFGGSLDDLRAVRAAVSLPVLRKDFIVHEVQIHEAVCAGADAVLLIVAALAQPELEHLLDVAQACQVDALVEVHTLEELDRALDAGARILGVNNRNLATFTVDLATTEHLAEEVPEDVLLVSESGIREPADARRVYDAGANALLVGEALMRSGDPVAAIRGLLGAAPSVG
jgi:indole-3-glycerol phosphate synthase